MNNKQFDVDSLYKCVRNFRDLGTGRKSEKVLVGDSDDARTSHFSFVANILYNRPSCNEVKFTNGEVFYISSEIVRSKPAHIFLWNELTADLWFRQKERTKILEWLKTARPQDGIVMAKFIVEKKRI